MFNCTGQTLTHSRPSLFLGFTVPRAVERQSLVPICKIEVVSDSAVVQHTKSPLCKLEEMKSQLPAVAGKSQGLYLICLIVFQVNNSLSGIFIGE